MHPGLTKTTHRFKYLRWDVAVNSENGTLGGNNRYCLFKLPLASERGVECLIGLDYGNSQIVEA